MIFWPLNQMSAFVLTASTDSLYQTPSVGWFVLLNSYRMPTDWTAPVYRISYMTRQNP